MDSGLMRHSSEKYETEKHGETLSTSVMVAEITSPSHVLDNRNNPILSALSHYGLSDKIGIYFYRHKAIQANSGFIKIGEVSRTKGVQERFKRGWHGTEKYSDTYLGKKIHHDISTASSENPVFFIFYEQVAEFCFPKIDELSAFASHHDEYGVSTRNSERMNKNHALGRKLIWREPTFSEVRDLKFPSGTPYF